MGKALSKALSKALERHCNGTAQRLKALLAPWGFAGLSSASPRAPLVLAGLSWPLLTPAPFAGPLLASAAHFPVPLPGLPLAQLCPALLELDEEPSGDKTLEPMTASDEGRPKTRWHSTRCFFVYNGGPAIKTRYPGFNHDEYDSGVCEKMASWRNCYTWDALPRTPDLKVGMFNPAAC